MYALKVKTDPTEEPVTLEEAKLFLRVDHTDEDDLISSIITAARVWAEEYTQRAFVTQTLTLLLDKFPGGHMFLPELAVFNVNSSVIYLPRSPVASVDEIRYIDTEGTQQTVSNFRADTDSEPGRIIAEFGDVWPPTRPVTNAVEVDFTAGYGAASAVPDGIKAAIKIMVENWYSIRQPVVIGTTAQSIPYSAESLLGSYKVGTTTGSI